MSQAEKKSSTSLIALSWIIVLVPLAWGVVQSVVKAAPLFQSSSPSSTRR
jgi:hypothetical protein